MLNNIYNSVKMKKHINKFISTSAFEAEKEQLNQLKHFVAYDAETNKIYLKRKDIVAYDITFNVTPDDATIKYSINSTAYDQTATNGELVSVNRGSTIYYKVSKNGYTEKSGNLLIQKAETITVSLDVKQFTFTVNPTPSDAIVTLNDEVRNSIKVDYNTEVTWSVEKEGYVTQSGTTNVTDDETKDVTLVLNSYDVQFNVTPSDAVINYSIDEETYDQTTTNGKPIIVAHGSILYYKITKLGYTDKIDSITINKAETITVSLDVKQFTFTINPTPSDATVKLNNEVKKSITVDYNTEVTWSVEKTGYVTQSGTTTVTDDETKDVTLVLNSYDVKFNVTPSDAVIKYSIDEETYDQTATNNVSFKVNHGSTVYYQVSKEGYDTITSSKLINKNETIDVNVSVTNHNVTFNVTPDGATIKYSIDSTAYDQTATNGSPITVAHGSIVNYKITKLGYNDKIDSITINKDETITVSLDIKQFTFTINPTPSDATVTLNDEVKKSITVDYNTKVTWSVEKTGYTTQSGTTTVTDDETKDITLVIKSYDVAFNVTPSDAIIKYSIDEETYDQTATNNVSFKVNHGSTVYYRISKEGYTTVTNSKEIVQEETIDVNITVTNHNVTFNVTPSDSIIYYSINEESYNKTATNNKPIIVAYGSTVYYKVTKVGYNEKLGDIVVDGDETITVSLDIKQFTFTVNPTPSDATVKLNNEVKKSITVDYNTEVTWSVEKTGYTTQSGTTTVTKNETKDVTLVIKSYDVKFNVRPSDATIKYSIDNQTYSETATNNIAFMVIHGSTVYYQITREGFITETNSKLITTIETIDITMTAETYEVKFNVTPSDATIKYSINSKMYSETATNNVAFNADYSDVVYYKITREGYDEVTDYITIYNDETISESLTPKQYTFTINPTPSDATVTINDVVRKSITVDYGTEVTWSVSKDNYLTQTGTTIVTSDEIKDVSLVLNSYDVTFVVTPSDASIRYSIDNTSYNEIATNGVPVSVTHGQTIYYKITKDRYDDKIGQLLIVKSETITINLTALIYGTVEYTTSDDGINVNLFNSQDIMNSKVKDCRLSDTQEKITTYNYTFPNKGVHSVDICWNPNNTDLNDIFKDCGLLTNVSDYLFSTCTAVTSCNDTFNNCSGLTSIPDNLFTMNTEVKSFNNTFVSCPISYIPSTLFSANEKALTFDGTFNECSGLTSIPTELFINCPNVTSFDSTFSYCSSLQSIPDGLFANKTEVTNFNETFSVCESLTSIGNSAFEGCSTISEFTNTFSGCTNITTIGDYAFANCTSVSGFDYIFSFSTKLQTLGNGVFSGCSNVTTFSNAFYGCTSLINVSSNLFAACDNVTDFSYVFYQCEALTEVPTKLFADKQLANDFNMAFAGCINLHKIGDGAFSGCTSVTTFDDMFISSLELNEIGVSAFEGCTALIDFSTAWPTMGGMPLNITKIGDSAFKNCTNMTTFTTSINFNNNTNLTYIGASAFENCSSLTTFQDAFEGCINLTTIGAYAFKGCSSVTSFLNAFYGCNKLTSVQEGLFSGCTKVTTFDSAFLNCSTLQIMENNAFDTCSAVTSFTSTFEGCVNLTTIGAYAFNNCKNIETFESTFTDCSEITTIGDYAFNNCRFVTSFKNTFTCNSTLQSIGSYAFANCVGISDCSGLFSGYTALTTVGDGIFSGCTKVTNFESLFLNCNKLKSVGSNLFDAEGQIHIFRTCKSMFNGCSSLSMISPNALKVGSTVRITDVSYMFNNCTSLKSVPETLFNNLSYVTDASFIFNNSGIETLPSALFKYNTNITTFKGAFLNCDSLTSIPSDLFSTNTAVTNFANTFGMCTNLTEIPEGLFSTNTAVTTFQGTFASCVNLTTIPSGLFVNNTAVTTFQGTFNSCGLTSIPSGLFHNSPNVISFESTFSNNQALLSIPDELFVGCPNVTSFESTFSSNKSLTSIPNNLFSVNTAVVTFNKVFQACSSLKNLPSSLFSTNTAVTNFGYSFYNCTNLTGGVPRDNDDMPIYYRSGEGKRGYAVVTTYTDCFLGCTKLDDYIYGDMPEDWR